MIENLKFLIEKIIKNKYDIDHDVQIFKSKKDGDLSTNICMQLASILKKNPMDIGNEIISEIKHEQIKKVEVASPGFINIYLTGENYENILSNILKLNKDFGRGNQNKFIDVEYVSANPTGYLHVGHARNAAVGSTLSNILLFAGNKVDQEYWLNDSGSQINILAEAVWTRYQQYFGKDIEMPKDTYRGQDIKDAAEYFAENVFQTEYLDVPFKECFEVFRDESIKYMLSKIKQDLKDFNVHMDIFTSEKSVISGGAVKETIEQIKDKTYQKDGSLWLKTTEKGDDKDRVIIKSDGAYTYFAPDIAGHNYKISRKYDELINVFGADHIGYGPRLKIAVQFLGLPAEKFDILVMQMVNLVRDGKPFKMSKRKGTSFTMREFMELVGVDVARYNLVAISCDAHLDFDVKKATEKTNDNPVYTIQYSHARANQILNKAEQKIKAGHSYKGKEVELINKLNDFPKLIDKIANNHKIHLLPKYLLKVARLFNSFYSNEYILNTPRESELLALVQATKIVIKNGLSLLGVSSPDKI